MGSSPEDGAGDRGGGCLGSQGLKGQVAFTEDQTWGGCRGAMWVVYRTPHPLTPEQRRIWLTSPFVVSDNFSFLSSLFPPERIGISKVHEVLTFTTWGWNDLSSAPVPRSVWVLAPAGTERMARGRPVWGAGRALPNDPGPPREEGTGSPEEGRDKLWSRQSRLRDHRHSRGGSRRGAARRQMCKGNPPPEKLISPCASLTSRLSCAPRIPHVFFRPLNAFPPAPPAHPNPTS